MKIRLRLTGIHDAQRIWDMQKLAFQELLLKYQDFDTNPASEPLEKVTNRLSQNGRSYYFIELEDEIIGAISVTDRGDGGRKVLSTMFILPEFQGHGYAQEAIVAAEAIYGKDFWELDTILQEEKLCHLYEKMGYCQTQKITPVSDIMSLVFYEK